MITELFGAALALGAALTNAVSKVLIRKGTDTGRSDHVILVVSFVNILVVVPVAAVLYYPNYGLSLRSIGAFVLAGLLASLMGRVLNFKSIERIGVSRTVPIVSTHAVVAMVSAMLVLRERPTPLHILGVLLVISGVATVSWETSRDNPQSLSRRALLLGMVFPFGAALFYGLEPTVAKIGLNEGTPFLVGLAIRVSVALVAFTAFLAVTQRLPTRAELVDNRTNLKLYLGAAITNTLVLFGYYAALQIAPVSVVAPLLPTDILFTLLLSIVWLPERLETVTVKLLIAAIVVIIGVVMITAFA